MKIKKATNDFIIEKLNSIRSRDANKKIKVVRYSNGFKYASSYIYELFKRTTEKTFDLWVNSAKDYEKETIIYTILDVQKSNSKTYYYAETEKYFIYVLYAQNQMSRYEVAIVIK